MTNQFVWDHPVNIFIPLYIVRFGEYNLWIVENRAVKNQILSSVQCHRQTVTSITFILVMRSECSLNLYIYIYISTVFETNSINQIIIVQTWSRRGLRLSQQMDCFN